MFAKYRHIFGVLAFGLLVAALPAGAKCSVTLVTNVGIDDGLTYGPYAIKND